LGELYLGSSPGFRKVHARLVGSLDTHVIDFNVVDAPTDPADWYERELLRLSRDDLARVDLGTLALKNGETGFELEGVAEGEQLNPDKVEEFLRAVTSLSFLDELGDQGKDAFEQGELILEYTVTRKDGQHVKYTVVAPSEVDYYVLKASTYPYYFKVAKKTFDDLRALGRDQLVQAGERPEIGDRSSEIGDQGPEAGDQESEAGD